MRANALSGVSSDSKVTARSNELGNNLEVGVDFATVLDSLVTSLDAALVVALLKLGGTLVRLVRNVLVQLPRLCVVLDGLVELALLVELGALLLELVRLRLGLLRSLCLLVLLGFRLRFGLWRLLGLLGNWLQVGHLLVVLFLHPRLLATLTLCARTCIASHASHTPRTAHLHVDA
jgi:hypothetical protein